VGTSDRAGQPDPSETALGPSVSGGVFLSFFQGEAEINETSLIGNPLDGGYFATLWNPIHPNKLDRDDHFQLHCQRVILSKGTRLPEDPYPHIFPAPVIYIGSVGEATPQFLETSRHAQQIISRLYAV
jgi:hypothetical protein